MDNRIMFRKRENEILVDQHAQPIYHRKQIAVDQSQTVSYFRELTVGGSKLDTNLTIGGMLPSPHEFDLWGLSFAVAMGTPIADVQKLYNYSYFTLFLNTDRVFCEAPLHMVPQASGLNGVVATTASDTTYQSLANGTNNPAGYFPLNVGNSPLLISEQMSFYVELKIAAPAVFSATFYTWFVMHGILRKAR